MKKKLCCLALSAMLSVALFLPQNSSAAEPISKTLRVQVFPGNVANLYAYLGVTLGVYKDEGLDVQLVQIGSGPQVNAALISKSVDVIIAPPDNILLLKARGFNPVAVVGAATKPNFVLIARDPSSFPNLEKGYPELMNDMQGRKVGVYARGSASERFVKFLLQGVGKPEDTVQFVTSGGPGQAVAGLMAKQLDVASEVFSAGLSMEMMGGGKIILDCSLSSSNCPDSISTPGAMGIAYYALDTYLASNEEAVHAFVRAHRRIDAWIQDPRNRDAMIKEFAERTGAPPNVDKEAYFEALADWAPGFFSTAFSKEALEASQRGMLSTGDLSNPLDLESIMWK